jgi:hypothetical protein
MIEKLFMFSIEGENRYTDSVETTHKARSKSPLSAYTVFSCSKELKM